MSISASLRSLRFVSVGFAAGVLTAVLGGCPSATCPNCDIKAAEFTVTPADGAKIDSVVVHAKGEFTDHCPDPPSDEKSCTLSGDFASKAEAGEHEVTLEDWPFDSDDSVSATVTVKQTTERGEIVTEIPEGDVTFKVVKSGSF